MLEEEEEEVMCIANYYMYRDGEKMLRFKYPQAHGCGCRDMNVEFTAWGFKPCDQVVEGSVLLRGIARRLVTAWKP